MMGVHPSFGFRLLCRVNLAREVLCCSLKSHSDGIGCVAGFALAVPIVTGRGENFGVRVRHGRGWAAAAIKAAFLRGEECPDKDRSLLRRCIGDPGRDERIYGDYAGTTVVLRVPALPPCRTRAFYRCQCRSRQSWRPASGEDLAVTFR